jgi:hypothetical protein
VGRCSVGARKTTAPLKVACPRGDRLSDKMSIVRRSLKRRAISVLFAGLTDLSSLAAVIMPNQQIDAFENGLPVERDGGYLVNIPMEKPESWKRLLRKMFPDLEYWLIFAVSKLYPCSVSASPIHKQVTGVGTEFLLTVNVVQMESCTVRLEHRVYGSGRRNADTLYAVESNKQSVSSGSDYRTCEQNNLRVHLWSSTVVMADVSFNDRLPSDRQIKIRGG